jgi:hypothetical protein
MPCGDFGIPFQSPIETVTLTAPSGRLAPSLGLVTLLVAIPLGLLGAGSAAQNTW